MQSSGGAGAGCLTYAGYKQLLQLYVDITVDTVDIQQISPPDGGRAQENCR